MKRTVWIGVTMICCLILSSGIVLISKSHAEGKLPKIITMTSWPEGTAAYAWSTGFRKAIEQFSPMKKQD
jgi:hypothetical protein